MATFYVIGTPIGNLEDITFRALRILKEVDLILCEDTRVTRKLLDHYNISTRTESFHQHSDEKKIKLIINFLEQGKNIALVTDSGTPNVSDPGGVLVTRIKDLGIRIEPVPGPSALTTLISVAGIDLHEFLFLGFLPHKKGRQTLVKKIIASEIPVIVYESVHRVEKFLNELEKFGLGSERQLIIGRELTKIFETIYRGNLEEIKEQLVKDQVKGEFVIIIDGQ
jgi:16S rRNA (cytidine1402-2'-O)-methyltransferase